MEHQLSYTKMVKEIKLYTLNDIIAMYYEAHTGNSKMENSISRNINGLIMTLSHEIEMAISNKTPGETLSNQYKHDEDKTLIELMRLIKVVYKSIDQHMDKQYKKPIKRDKRNHEFKVHRTSHKVVAINNEVLHNENLSSEAKAVHAFLSALPLEAEPDFELITSNFSDNPVIIQNAIKELKNHGYLNYDYTQIEIQIFIKHLQDCIDHYINSYIG